MVTEAMTSSMRRRLRTRRSAIRKAQMDSMDLLRYLRGGALAAVSTWQDADAKVIVEQAVEQLANLVIDPDGGECSRDANEEEDVDENERAFKGFDSTKVGVIEEQEYDEDVCTDSDGSDEKESEGVESKKESEGMESKEEPEGMEAKEAYDGMESKGDSDPGDAVAQPGAGHHPGDAVVQPGGAVAAEERV